MHGGFRRNDQNWIFRLDYHYNVDGRGYIPNPRNNRLRHFVTDQTMREVSELIDTRSRAQTEFNSLQNATIFSRSSDG